MGKVKINSKQLPVKAHFFFFMAAMGPILPFITVYGKQLGVSPEIMGTVTAVLPILFLVSKPPFGFVVDYFRDFRKLIFVGLVTATSLAFVTMYFLPGLPERPIAVDRITNVTVDCNKLVTCNEIDIAESLRCNGRKIRAECRWRCSNENNFSSSVILENKSKYNFSSAVIFDNESKNNSSIDESCLVDYNVNSLGCNANNDNRVNCELSCKSSDEDQKCLYRSWTFWGFVVLMSLGCIGFNVSNSISDAVCFDVLGPGGEMGYGRQRVWGTIGFGVTAFLAGYTVDLWSEGQEIKNYTPAFILVFVFTGFDILCCTRLELPIISGSKTIAKDIYGLLKMKPIVIFLCFATLAGILDSFIIYFLFWYLEDLAEITGHMGQIKLIEGLIVAAETLGGEVIFFSFSGKILKKIGYGYTFVFCFVCYAIRLGLVSLAPNPWWVILIELFMQGPTYALCYTTIVAFASVVAPPGTSATVQGIVAGMDDGFGFALGSLVGGFLYKKRGGVTTLRTFSILAMICSLLYFVLHVTYLKHAMPETKSPSKESKTSNVEWRSPEDAARTCDEADEA